MIKLHVFHTTSQYLVIISFWITDKILTGDITHKYKKLLFCIGKYYEKYLLWDYEANTKVSNNW
jgi:hypothetical protein